MAYTIVLYFRLTSADPSSGPDIYPAEAVG
jgi:hypothetical protein